MWIQLELQLKNQQSSLKNNEVVEDLSSHFTVGIVKLECIWKTKANKLENRSTMLTQRCHIPIPNPNSQILAIFHTYAKLLAGKWTLFNVNVGFSPNLWKNFVLSVEQNGKTNVVVVCFEYPTANETIKLITRPINPFSLNLNN